MPVWVQAGFAITFLLLLLRGADSLVEVARVLRRIEARLTFLAPLEIEQKLMDEGLGTLKAGIRDRAVHPDIWISKIIKEEGDLRGEELKRVRNLLRNREKHYRD